jgi:hypothetical protein
MLGYLLWCTCVTCSALCYKSFLKELILLLWLSLMLPPNFIPRNALTHIPLENPVRSWPPPFALTPNSVRGPALTHSWRHRMKMQCVVSLFLLNLNWPQLVFDPSAIDGPALVHIHAKHRYVFINFPFLWNFYPFFVPFQMIFFKIIKYIVNSIILIKFINIFVNIF